MERLPAVSVYLRSSRVDGRTSNFQTRSTGSKPMPYYEYRCGSNGRTLEVRHAMAERLETWGELAERAGVEPGSTPANVPVERLMSAPVPLTGSGKEPAFAGCGGACACARGA
jgi:hypothetical protein